jgi:hypothetical protein
MADNFSETNGINPANLSGFSGTTSPGGEFNPSTEREGFANHPHFDGIERTGTQTSGGGMSEGFSAAFANIGPTVSRYVDTYDRSLRANPYLHIGLAGAGALVLGYLFGRATAPASTTVRGMSDIEAAYDE